MKPGSLRNQAVKPSWENINRDMACVFDGVPYIHPVEVTKSGLVQSKKKTMVSAYRLTRHSYRRIDSSGIVFTKKKFRTRP